MNTESLWRKIRTNRDYQKWAKEHDAYEQLDIIRGWCQYEDYDVLTWAKDASQLVCMYCFIQFVLSVEFMVTVQEMAQDTSCEEFDESDVKNAQLLLAFLHKA